MSAIITTIEMKKDEIKKLERKLETLRKELRQINLLECPKCKEHIAYLINAEIGMMTYDFDPIDGYDERSFTSDGTTNDYKCPICNTVLATSEKEAEELFGKAKEEK